MKEICLWLIAHGHTLTDYHLNTLSAYHLISYLFPRKIMTDNIPIWQRSLAFSSAIMELSQELQKSRPNFRLFEQIEAAATSIVANVTLGQERTTPEETWQLFLAIRRSINEIMTILGVFKLRRWLDDDRYQPIHIQAFELTKMLEALTKV